MRRLDRALRWIPPLAVLIAVAALAAIANIPTTTTVGIDYVVTTRRVPLYQKLIAFVDRDIQMRSIAREAAAGTVGAEERALKRLEWTHANVRPQPPALPVIDDHPYHVVIRGYGTFDQAADVFATLAGYQGVPANFVFARWPDGGAAYAFAIVYLDGAWRVFDVREGRALRSRDGRMASVEELRSDASLTAALPQPREAAAPYPALVGLLPQPSDLLRPNDQMVLGRIWQELIRLSRRR